MDDGSCISFVVIRGCVDPTAINYDSSATDGEGVTCVHNQVSGCTDPTATNYVPDANVNDGSCTFSVIGCMVPTALNYDSTATVNANTCRFAQSPPPPAASPPPPLSATPPQVTSPSPASPSLGGGGSNNLDTGGSSSGGAIATVIICALVIGAAIFAYYKWKQGQQGEQYPSTALSQVKVSLGATSSEPAVYNVQPVSVHDDVSSSPTMTNSAVHRVPDEAASTSPHGLSNDILEVEVRAAPSAN